MPPGGALRARLAQHPLAERDDQAGFLGRAEELPRLDHLVAAPPADQRLGPGHPRGGQLHDRLELQGELAVADGLLQVADDLQPADHVRVHVRGVDLDPVAAGVLRPRHGHVRVAQHQPGRVDVGQRDAHARGERDLLASHPERLGADRAGQPLGNLRHLLGARGVLDQDGELVAAPAGHRVVHRDDGAQPPGRLGQHEVTRAVADRVVDRGEAVQVQEDDAGPGGHRGVAQHVTGAFLDVGPVGQAGQAVVEGEVVDLLAQRDLVAHVARGDQHLDGLAGHLVAQQGRLDVPPRPVGGPDPDREPAGALESLEALASFGVAAEGQPDRGQHGGPVLGMDEVEQPPAGQRRGRVAVVLDRRARVPDHAVQVADQDDVAGPVGQVAQAPAGLPPDAEHGQVLPHQHEDPRGQHEHPGAACHDQRDPGRRRAGQAVGYHHHGGHGGGQHRDDGRRR